MRTLGKLLSISMVVLLVLTIGMWFALHVRRVKPMPVVTVVLPPSRFESITKELGRWFFEDPEFSVAPGSIDIVHMRGSGTMGSMIAVRLRAVVGEQFVLEQLGSRRDLTDMSFGFDSRYPSWLQAPWVDDDQSLAYSGRLDSGHALAGAFWFWRPHACELIFFIGPNAQFTAPAFIKNIFIDIPYQHESMPVFVGNDWREWAYVHLTFQ